MPEKKPSKPTSPSNSELLELLVAAIDGVDGYESERGDLRYWDAASIDRARRLLDSIEPTPPHEPRRIRD